MSNYSERLKTALVSKNMWHRFIEFDEPVKTVEQAGRKVAVEKIAKSIVMLDSDGVPLLAILPARCRISHKKIKRLLALRDVRLASPDEVLRYSGYPAGGVPPLNDIKRVLVDETVLKMETAIVGGGDVNKLVEIKTHDIMDALNPKIADIIEK
jgi:prolyl-tRNA editing enzyme YbaK/EbsC (Cys-tRNA(Pro) deacylase)